MAYSKYGLSFKNFTDSYGEWEANGGVEQANKAIDFKNLQNNSFNVRGLPGGTFGQSVIDSTLGVVGNIDDFLGGPTGLGDYANNYVTAQEMAMGKKPSFDFSWDYFMNGLPRDTGNLIGSMVGLGVPVGAAVIAAPHLGISSGVAATGGALLGAGLEAGAEGGSKLRESLERGETLDDSQGKALEVFLKNAGLLGTTNLLGVSALRKAAEGVKKAFNAGRASSTGAIVSTPSRALEFAKGASLLEANALTESVQEAVQQGIQDSVEPDKEYGVLPWNWNEEQKERFYDTLAPMLLVGGAGGATRVGARKAGEWFSPDKLEQGEIDITANQDVSIPAQANYTIADEVSDANLSQGTESKLRMLDEAYYKQYGQHLYVTSMTRHWGTNSDHETGSAFDVADDRLANDSERRQWIAEKARQLGLNPLDEYENPSSGATGGHMHFSDKGGAVNVDTSGWSGNADIDSLIADTANRYGIDPNLLAAIAEQESGFNQSAQSKAGALGIMQLMPDTANGLGVDANDLAGNIEGGAKYIKQMLDQFGGDVHKALEAYNGGPGGVGNAETMKYADEVMQRYEKFKTKSAGTFSWSNPAETQADSTDYMKIMSDNNVTADTAGDFLQYVRLLAEDDANANNEQVQKDGAKAVKAIADGSPDVMERVAKELGYGQVKQEVEQEAPNIPMPKIRQHVQKNGWVEFRSKENADEFARTDYGKTLERVSNTRFVSPDFNAITGRAEPRTAQPQQVAQPAPQPTVQNKVQSDVAQPQNETEEKQKRNDKPLSAGEVNILNSIAQKMPQEELRIIAQHMRNGEYNTVRGIIQQYNPEASLIADNVGKAIAIARNLLGNPMATQNKSGTRIDVKKAERILKGRNLDVINRLNLSMGRNLKSNGEPMSAGLKFPSPDRSVENVERARVAAAKVAERGIPHSGEIGSSRGVQAPAVEEIKFPEPKLEEDNIPTGLKAKLNKVANNLSAENANTAENTLAKTKQTGKPAVNPTEELFDTNNAKKNINAPNERDSKPQKKPAEGKSSQNEPMPPQKASDGENAISLKNIEGFTDRDLKEAEKMGISFTPKGRLVDGKPVYDIEFASQKDADKFVREFFGEAEDGDVTQEIKAAGKENAKENEIDENIKNGKKAIKSILENHKDVPKAMYRDEVGYIDFVYGKEGTIKKDRSDGYGLAKILEKHGQEAVSKIPEVIAKGKYEKSEYGDRAYFLFDGYRAVIRFTWDGDKKTWLVTNFLDNKKKDSGDADAFVRSAPTTDGTTSPSEQNPSMDSIPQSKENLNIVVTDDGKEFKVAYKVMPAEDVVASNLPTDGLPVNKDYPSAMQPRNRQRAAMQEQITSMSNNLRPADLAESRNLNQGAPVIKSDGAVLNGNGRTIAIQKAWLNDKADKYKQYLLDNAEKLGINPADIEGTEHPILVRVVQDKLSKDDIMSMINSTTGGQRMSPSEQAKVDSGKIKSSTLNQYVAGSDLTSAANRNFLRDVLADIISPSERNAYYSKEGAINQDGVLRAQRALFALAYGDDTLLDAFSEAVNEEAKNFSNALKANAPLIARLQQLIKTGNATDLGLQKNLVSAVKALKEAVIAGKPAKSIWQEMSMFEDTEHSPETIAIARAMDGYRRSGKKLTQFVRNLAELGLKHGNPNQSGLFGEDEAPQVKLTDDIATAKEYVDTGNQMDMFAPKYSRDKNVDNKADMKDNKNRKISDEYDKLEKEEKAVVDEAVNNRINQLFSRVADYVQRGFDDAFSADDGKAGINKLLEDSRRNDVLKNLLQYANRFSTTPSNYKEVLNTLAPGLNTDGFTKEQLIERYNEYRDVAREMLNYGQYVYAELCERHRQHYAGLRKHGGQNAGAGTVRSRNEEARRFDWEREQAEVVTKLFRRQETFNFNKKHSEKNSRSAFSFANPDTAEELKSTGNIDTPLDRLPKLPASKLRDGERKMQAFGKAIGVPVHFVSHPDKGYRGVFTHNGEVYINRNATIPAKAIFLHEFTHWLKASGKENRAVFDALAACVERDSGLFHERRLKQYRDRIFGGEQMTDEEIIEEIICDAMGNSKTAERISKAIDNFAPELNQSIWGRIKAMWDKFCQMVGFKQELSSKKQSLPNGLSQQEMAKFNAQLNILMSKMRTADGKPMFKVKNYQLVVAENGKRPSEIFDINNINDYTPTYNIPAMPSSYSYQVHAQREAVRQQYEGTKEWMKAPNGEPTNLTEEQWLDVRTPNFKAWFGDWENNPDEASKVVDENGEPLVVYHGRNSKLENDTIRTEGVRTTAGTGAWFSNKENISAQYGDNIYPCFLNIRSPYTADLKGAPAGEFSKAIAYDIDTNEEVKVAFDNGDGSAFKEMDTYITGDLKDTNYEKYDVREEVYDTDSLVREVRNDKNVDGVVIKNVSDIPEGDTTDSVDYDNLPVADDYVVFNSNQIKSATENTGAFSPDTNNIKYSRPDTETARLDKEYMSLVDEFNNAESDEEKQVAHDKLVKLVEQAAEKAGFKDAIPEQTPAYQIRTKAAPKKSVKVYKVFTMSDDGKPTALFIGGTEKLPQGVWLDAVAAYNFVAKNGKSYVPSTQNPYTKGGKTGASVEIPNEKVRQELINRGFLPEGSTAKKITALAYRPGWHAGTMPFFPQGGKKPAKGEKTNYENIHRYNQVVFECELAADKDYTAEAEAQPKARTKTGKLNTKNADLQYMPEDGFYYYATNPMTHGHPELGMWAISGSLKINKALTQEECDKILTDNNLLPQEWEGGEMSLEKLGYTGEENDAARKTLAPITYDDDGNVIPLSQRFDVTNPDVRYSRDRAGITASTDNAGIFKRAMTALENKLKGKMPDNLDVRTYEDIEADRENARRAKAASRGKEYLDRSKEVSPFEMWWASPSRLAKKIPLVSPFVQMAKIAVDKQEKLRVEFNSGMNEIEDMLGYSKWGSNDKKYKERKMALQEALLQGDIARKVFTDDELKRGGLDEQTIKAYRKMRELLDKAYTMADQTYSRTKYVSRNWPTAAEADGFMNDLMKKNPFVQIIQKKQNADGTVTYTYKEPHQYTVSELTVTEAELDELKKNKDVIITSEKHIYGDMFGNSTYRVTYHQKKANLGKIQGYIPHIFHGWLVCEVDENGNILKDSAGNIIVATSKNSMTEAVKEGKKIAGQNADKHYMVLPKLSKFNDGAAERAAIMGDFDYSKTMSKVANGMKMSIADAERFMKDTVSVQNRGRFLAYAQHRKGVQGYEQNVFLATQMYFNQIARYVALDPFKRDAISTYNRLFGSFTDNAVIKRSRNAKYIYEYINDMNGVPNGVEMWMNDMLHNMGLGQEVANGRPGLWLEHMFTYPFTIAKLGILNMSSALLNLTQLFNLYGAMGEKVLSGAGYERLLKKGFVDARKAITNKNSQLGQLVWKDLGLEAQIGIDVAGGYSKTEVSGLASLTGRLSKLAGGSMYLFRLSDTYTRAVTLLTAYNKALDEGMTKQEAIEYAKEINDKVNFDYSTADSPGIFRAFGPLSKVLLQFKKYPVKQIELFMDIFNDGRAAGLNRKQSALRLMKYTAPYMAFSGMMGIPFISLAGGILSAIMSAATGDDDWDWQQKIKQYMVETFGADNPLTLWWLYGAGSFIGVNVGSRVGVGDFMGIENREKSTIDSILGMTTATSTVAQTTKQLGYGNYAEAVKAISPSAGNILIGLKGEVHTTRGRMKYQYQNAYEQALRMIGFNPLNETMAGDIASNDYANKQAEKRAKDDAIDAFIEEPTAENAAKLNELGVTPKSIQTEMARRKMNRAELNRLAEEEKAAKAKKSKQKKKQYSVNDYLKGK